MLTKLRHRIDRFFERNKIRQYFDLPRDERVRIIKNLYCHTNKVEGFESVFGSPFPSLAQRSPYYDLIAAYANELRPDSVHQVGCFTASDSRSLMDGGYAGRVIASDYDLDRLTYLKQRFSGTNHESIELRQFDLEGQDYTPLNGSEMVIANAVFSNLQPETIDFFFSQLASCEVRLVVISDIITKDSLTTDPNVFQSLKSKTDRNWYHRYLAVARKNDVEAFFLPDFVANGRGHARANLIFHRGIDPQIHNDAISQAFTGYVGRQGTILRELALLSR